MSREAAAKANPAASEEASDPSWSDLTADLYGVISTFLDIADGELTNLCIVVGREVSLTVKRTFLRDNEDYLRYSLCVAFRDVGATKFFGQRKKCKDNILQWMEANDNWTDKCSMQNCSNMSGNLLFGSSYPGGRDESYPFAMRELHVAQMTVKRRLGGMTSYEGFKTSAIEEVFTDNTKFAGVRRGDIIACFGPQVFRSHHQIHSMRHDQIKNLLENSVCRGAKLGFLYLRSVDAVFANPTVAAELGLTPVTRHLVRTRGLGHSLAAPGLWRGTGYFAPEQNTAGISTACAAYKFAPDASAFEYIAGVPGIDLGSPTMGLPKGTMPALLAQSSSDRFVQDNDRFRILIQHPTVTPYLRGRGGNANVFRLMVRNAVKIPRRGGEIECPKQCIERVSLLLQEGADADFRDENGRMPLNLARKWKHSLLRVNCDDELMSAYKAAALEFLTGSIHLLEKSLG